MSGFRSRFLVCSPRVRSLGRAALVVAALLACGAPAQAQFLGSWGYRRPEPPPPISPDVLAERLNRSGFRVYQIRRNAAVYLVDASDPGGRMLRLIVDSMDGTILQRFATANPQAGAPDGGVGAPQPGFAPADGASPRPQTPQAPRARSAPSAATVTPAPEQAPPPAQPPVAVMAPAPEPMPGPALVGPGYANGVPINPLD